MLSAMDADRLWVTGLKGLIALLALVCLWLAVRLLWLLLVGPQVAGTAERPAAAAGPEVTANLQRLSEYALFGRSGAAPAPAAAPDTRLDLSLIGVFSTASADAGYAVIRGGGQERAYAPGDALPGGATLEAVYPDRVTLRREGQLEALRLPEAAGVARPGGDRRPVADAPPSRVALPGIRPSGNTDPAATSAFRLDLNALSNQVHVQPMPSGGFRLFPGRDATLFQELGLQANDVVTAVNGQPLNSVADAMRLFEAARDADRLSVTVQRNGQELTLNPDLDRLRARLENS